MVLFSISSPSASKFSQLKSSLQQAFSGRILPGGESILERGGDAKAATRPRRRWSPPPRRPPAAAIARENAAFAQLKVEIDGAARSASLSGSLRTSVERRGLVVRLLTDGVAFDSGSAVLKAPVRPLLARVGRLLSSQAAQGDVLVEGYTDTVPVRRGGPYPTNWELSTARASSVVRYLIRTGMPPAAWGAAAMPICARSRPTPPPPGARATAAWRSCSSGPGRRRREAHLKIGLPLALAIAAGAAYELVLAKPGTSSGRVHGAGLRPAQGLRPQPRRGAASPRSRWRSCSPQATRPLRRRGDPARRLRHAARGGARALDRHRRADRRARVRADRRARPRAVETRIRHRILASTDVDVDHVLLPTSRCNERARRQLRATAAHDRGVLRACRPHALREVAVEVVVEIGRKRLTIGEALELVPGAVVALDRPADEPVDIVVNGRRIARGEVVRRRRRVRRAPHRGHQRVRGSVRGRLT